MKLIIGALVLGALIFLLTRAGGRKVAVHRGRHMRLRLHLRMHPGAGHATHGELWARWGRLASFRESGRTRPSLSAWYRLTHPASHSYYYGRAHHGRQIRVTVQEHCAILGPPRSHKSAMLSRMIMDAPGAVVSTSSKPDMYHLTAGVRTARGSRIHVFNPQGIGGIISTVRWSPLADCIVPATAIRRADAFTQAVSTNGTEDGTFWSSKASDGLRGMFAAAAIATQTMRKVSQWAGSDKQVMEAVATLDQNGHHDWAQQLAELAGPAEKTSATVRMVMSRALGFLHDPALAAAVLPLPGQAFDIDDFLLNGGTLYMIAKGNGDDCILAPLFAALADEIHHRATELGAFMTRQRLDPPLFMALDEVTQICPVPLPSWLADSGGQGVTIAMGFHGWAQIRARWGADAAQSVIDTTNVKVFMPGISDTDTLDRASKLAGQAAYTEQGSDQLSRHDVLTADMIRTLPPKFALVIRNGLAPVIIRVAPGWKHPAYRKSQRTARGAAPQPEQISEVTATWRSPEPIAAEPVAAIDGTGLLIGEPVAGPLPEPVSAGAPSFPWQVAK